MKINVTRFYFYFNSRGSSQLCLRTTNSNYFDFRSQYLPTYIFTQIVGINKLILNLFSHGDLPTGGTTGERE